ncbi:MAG: Outer membrane protein [Candidatus Magnetoglobus multicellularis str. Araruama]|uniref:Outer membrane protein n=1 Tax=Candidatus Magnetoglobus multicellularis str. Araruama TaxID=890399 RepID=A0A1V1P6U4_9BACT|nr:MAG: Outer membrane protein [Candidatus Magnetoglobus multicellularis str. Araruama]
MNTKGRYVKSFIILICLFTINSVVSADHPPKNLTLSQINLLHKVCENNFEIRYQKFDLSIAAEQAKKETAIFEPSLSASFNYKDSVTPNTAEQFFDRMYMEKFEERLKQYQLGLKGLLPTGTLLSLDYTIDEISNDLVENKYKDRSSETASYLGFQITQPLLKNRGTENTMAKIRIAQTAQDIAYQAFRQKVIDIVHNALNAYWELYYTTRQYGFYEDSVKVAQDLLQTYKLMYEAGKVAESELFEIRSGLALRQSLLNAALQKKIDAQNNIFKLLGMSRKGNSIEHIIILDTPESYRNFKAPKYQEVLDLALVNNPRYLSSKKHLKKQRIHTDYSQNQNLPDLNFKASFGINSLDDHGENFLENIWNDSDETWTVGLEFLLPLKGRIDSTSELRMAKLREKQAQLAVQSIKLDLENQVDTSIQHLESSMRQLKRHNENLKLKQKIMDVEMSRLEGGKSNIINVLEKEKNLNQARNGHLRAIVNLELSGVALSRIEGTLLKRFGVNIEKHVNME